MAGQSPRMSAPERREQILAAATEVFGALGFVGGTTDAVAKAAGISQAYVVRTFGSKEALVIAVIERAHARVQQSLRKAITTFVGTESTAERGRAISLAYKGLVTDRGLLLTLMHGYTMGHDPVVGPIVRAGYLDVFRILRDEVRLSEADATRFLGHGMLIDSLLAMRILESPDPDALALTACTLDMDRDRCEALGVTLGLSVPAADFTSRR